MDVGRAGRTSSGADHLGTLLDSRYLCLCTSRNGLGSREGFEAPEGGLCVSGGRSDLYPDLSGTTPPPPHQFVESRASNVIDARSLGEVVPPLGHHRKRKQ